MKTITITPDIYKRIEELAESYTDVEAFVSLSLKNYLSKKAVEMERLGWFCDLSQSMWYRDAAEVKAQKCEMLGHIDKGCGWVYKP